MYNIKSENNNNIKSEYENSKIKYRVLAKNQKNIDILISSEYNNWGIILKNAAIIGNLDLVKYSVSNIKEYWNTIKTKVNFNISKLIDYCTNELYISLILISFKENNIDLFIYIINLIFVSVDWNLIVKYGIYQDYIKIIRMYKYDNTINDVFFDNLLRKLDKIKNNIAFKNNLNIDLDIDLDLDLIVNTYNTNLIQIAYYAFINLDTEIIDLILHKLNYNFNFLFEYIMIIYFK